MTLYKYGMRLRPFGIGCQPKGFYIGVDVDGNSKYWSFVWYEKPLTKEQCEQYELDYLGIETTE